MHNNSNYYNCHCSAACSRGIALLGKQIAAHESVCPEAQAKRSTSNSNSTSTSSSNLTAGVYRTLGKTGKCIPVYRECILQGSKSLIQEKIRWFRHSVGVKCAWSQKPILKAIQ